MIEKYRKKPIEIEAEQFVVWDLKNPPNYVDIHGVRFPVIQIPYDVHIMIPTLEGNMKAKNLDYIIKGIKGELYPCDQDIFLKSYDKVR
jgi:hypothetical protein